MPQAIGHESNETFGFAQPLKNAFDDLDRLVSSSLGADVVDLAELSFAQNTCSMPAAMIVNMQPLADVCSRRHTAAAADFR